jgi:hypothetical protein
LCRGESELEKFVDFLHKPFIVAVHVVEWDKIEVSAEAAQVAEE